MRNRFLLILLVLITQCATNKLSKEDIEAMKARFVLEYGKPPDLWPVMVGLKEEVYSIFPVPVENAVGTNVIDFAITLLRFEGDKIHYEQLIKGHPGASAGGLYSHCPVFDKEWIAYGQSRGFSLFNIKTKQFVDHTPYPQLEKRITAVAPVTSQPFTFLIQIERGNTPVDDRVLQIVRFDLKGNFEVLAELEQIGRHYGEKGEPWCFSERTFINYNRKDTLLEAFDLNFKPVQHPLCSLFNNRKKDDIDISRLNSFIAHPKLPFAILKEYIEGQGSRIWLLRWNQNEKEEIFLELIGQKLSVFSDIKKLIATHFEFSPDGKWLVFRDGSEEPKNPMFIAMPVDEDEKYFLGKPKMLGKVLRKNAGPVSSAWIEEPLSYVVSDGMVLYKWELNNLRREF